MSLHREYGRDEMSEKYTYDDVIINPKDLRVVIGKEYYYGKNPGEAISNANADDVAHLAGLEDSDNARFNPFFIDDYYYPCIIRKKEPGYVPFNLDNEEDKAKLRGAWIRPKDEPLPECQIYAIESDRIDVWAGDGYLTPDELLEFWEFIDGTPCGKPVEEEE